MELNLNSLSSKLYRWFYAKEKHEMPKSLCPYFWKLVIMYILILPFSIFCLPLMFEKKKCKPIDRFGMSIVAYVFLFIIFTLIYPICSLYILNPEKGLISAGICLWLIGFMFGVGFFINYLIKLYKKHRRNRLGDEKEKPIIVVEYIKGVYGKYCPKITWNEKGE